MNQQKLNQFKVYYKDYSGKYEAKALAGGNVFPGLLRMAIIYVELLE